MKKKFISPVELFNRTPQSANLEAMRTKGVLDEVAYDQRRKVLLVAFTRSL